jgi:hypothetical protein
VLETVADITKKYPAVLLVSSLGLVALAGFLILWIAAMVSVQIFIDTNFSLSSGLQALLRYFPVLFDLQRFLHFIGPLKLFQMERTLQ